MPGTWSAASVVENVTMLRLFILGFAAALAVAFPLWGMAQQSPLAATRGMTNHTIEIRDAAFVPPIVDARPGDTITLINHDIVPHTASAADESWDTGAIEPGQQARLTVPAKLAGRYFCQFHPSMKARI